MKRLFTIIAIIAGSILMPMAQTPGEVGTFFENSIKSTSTMSIKGGFGNQPNYMWNYNYGNGYAEFFLRIPEHGNYIVNIDNQTIVNSTGMFRFFDINPGMNKKIEIRRNNMLIYRGFIPVKRNTRLIADFFTMNGMYLLAEVPLNMPFGGGNYFDLWNNMWNGYYQPNNNYFNQNNWNPYYGLNGNYGQNYGPNNGYNNGGYNNGGQNNGNYNNGGYNNGNNSGYNNGYNNGYPNNNQRPNTPPNYNGPRTMNQQNFNQFLNTLKSTSFDNSKEELIKTQLNSADFTSDQVTQMLKLFSFDNSRLSVAKMCYNTCPDKQNYLNVVNTFTFDNSKNELTKYMNNQR